MFKIRFNKKIAFSNNSNLRFSVVRRRFFIFSNHKKGVVLLIVLGTLLVVASLATVILSLISSHSRLTYHQTNRIQAYYAAMAGVNYALEKLRTGAWTYSPINSCPDGNPPTSCTVSDTDFPKSILPLPPGNPTVYIVFCPKGNTCYGTSTPCGPPITTPITHFCVNSTATYTYTP